MNLLAWLNKQSLSRRLLLSGGLSLATVGLGTLWITYRSLQSDLEKQVRTRAQSITQSIEFATEGLLEVEQRQILRRVVQNYATLPTVVEIAIVNPDGMILADSQGSHQHLSYATKHPELLPAMNQAANRGIETSHQMMFHNKPVLVQILPFSSVLFGTSGRRGLAIAIVDLKQMQQEASETFLTSTLILLAGIAIILILMGILLRKNVLLPLAKLSQAVALSKETGIFSIPEKMPANEIKFLATKFQSVFEQLEAYEQLKIEIGQRQKVEEILRESEARERSKSEQLERTLLELQRTQTQLVQSEKMSSLGQLVAGVAHEINNPISFINGNVLYASQYIQELFVLLELYEANYPHPIGQIQERLEQSDLPFIRHDLPKLLKSMQVGCDRIREIVQLLRNFSRLDESEIKNVYIHEGIDSTLMLLQSRLNAKSNCPDIQVVKKYDNLPLIECYPGLLNQVFMNILINAIEAIEEKYKTNHAYNMDGDRKKKDELLLTGNDLRKTTPTLPIQTDPPQTLQAQVIPTITIRAEAIGSDRIAIRIGDNGIGICQQVQGQLFDPFFTTKPIGKGTGMGLSISYQIVAEKHHGSLSCQSEVAKGTEFTIEIPTKQKRSVL